MQSLDKFYIDGEWVSPLSARSLDVINPADETVVATVALGTAADVDKAVAAARAAFSRYGQSSPAERLQLLQRILEVYRARYDEIAAAITTEMGAPAKLASKAQAACGSGHLEAAIEVLQDYAFEERVGSSTVLREPIGVCGLITPWNWPINQIVCKVAPALATGCTMVLKPSEIAPLSAHLFAQVLDEAGVPAGVFNLVHGDGPTVGAAIAAHPGIDMVSFTGSTRAGVAVAQAAAPTVKRVTQELGGKSPNIILDDADLERAVTAGVRACFSNTGQSCNAPSRMLVPRDQLPQVVEIARIAAEKTRVGDPLDKATHLGPLVSATQFDKVQSLVQAAIDEGATLVCGGPGRPEGLEKGYYVRPTIFADVTNDMTIAREEVFGPVLVIIGYDDEEQAVAIANDTPYGLAAYVQSGDPDRARRIAKRLRAGQVQINGAQGDWLTPFGGYKQSGNGREWGPLGFDDYLETKALVA
ncbi:MAG: aldehyde dehydrogenase family protein [Gammaproteobacteria bacterium]|nr:aldehyde dehydrogenase family protein [Gammaproteobacteria bacterium]